MANELIPDQTATNTVHRPRQLPTSLVSLSLMYETCAEMREPTLIMEQIQHCQDQQKVRRIGAEAELFLDSDRGKAVYQIIAEMSRPATKEEIKKELQVLVGAFPNAVKADLQIYGRALALDIIDMQPAIEAVNIGCKALRRTSRFLPTINEALAWIGGVQDAVDRDRDLLSRLPAAVAWACGRADRPAFISPVWR